MAFLFTETGMISRFLLHHVWGRYLSIAGAQRLEQAVGCRMGRQWLHARGCPIRV
jgi:hypothetical protein